MKQLASFVNEAWLELKQVSWLTVPQAVASTWLVVFLVIIMAVYIFAVDKVLQIIFRILV